MRIAVIGAGHMGSWLIRELSGNHTLGVIETDKDRVVRADQAVRLNAYADLAEFGPDILINAASLNRTLEAFESALPHLPPGCLIADIASVKARIPEFYASSGFRFASAHPMFGPTFANVENLKNENAIIINESDPAGRLFFRDFFAGYGMNIFEYTFEEHDRMIGYSLALPFASTLVFAACMTETAVPGTTFKKHLEIAKGLLSEDDFLLAEIIFNPPALIQLENITGRLEFLKHVIRARDTEEAIRFFNGLRKNLGLPRPTP
jgi:prephenate dehydrogenase